MIPLLYRFAYPVISYRSIVMGLLVFQISCGGGGEGGQSKIDIQTQEPNALSMETDLVSSTSADAVKGDCPTALETRRDYSQWIADFGFDTTIRDTLSTHCAITTVVHIPAGDTAAMYDAIEAATARGDGVVIQLAAGTYELLPVEYPPFNPNQPRPDPIGGRQLPPIAVNVTLRGAGKKQTILSNTQRTHEAFFSVAAGASLILEDLSFRGGGLPTMDRVFGVTGNAIRNAEVVILNRVIIENFKNFREPGQENALFGVIHNQPNTTMIVAASEIKNNVSRCCSGAIHGKGAQLLIVDSQLVNNLNPFGGSGSAAMMEDGQSLVLSSSFINNRGRNQDSGGAGGALIPGHPATIIDSTFIANTSGDGIGSGYGGAIYFARPLPRPGEVQAPDPSYLLTIINSTFADNLSDSGGAIFVANAEADIINSTITRNIATPSSVDPGCCGLVNGSGGGIYAALEIDGRPLMTEVRLQNSILVRNMDFRLNRFCGGGIVSLGNNIIANGSDSTGGTLTAIPESLAAFFDFMGLGEIDPDCDIQTQASDLISDEVVIGTMLDTGAPGGVYFPLITNGSAIAGANASACPPADQLGQARFSEINADVQCDIGAVAGVSPALSPDFDQDGDVDRVDLERVLDRSGTPAMGNNDPLDIDQDGMITIADVRRMALLCNRWNCATE